nr:hypothetical protein [Tanacetum cinerariifolium]
TKIRNGRNSNAWFDSWHDKGPLSRVISQSTITAANLSLSARVRDLVSKNGWVWPNDWVSEYGEVLDIPMHTFNDDIADKTIWVNRKGRLKTQDRLSKWLNILDMACPFRKICKDSHSHLFFHCSYAKRLWERLVLGAMVYFVWQERNFRLFRKCERSNDKFFSIVTKTVRLKLMGLILLKSSLDVKKATED